MTDAVLVKTIYIKSSREKVWAYLTEGKKLARWFHEADCDLVTPGKDYALLMESGSKGCWGKILEVEPPNRLVYTFTHDWLKGYETQVEWILRDVDGGTQLTMNHTGLDRSKADPFAMLSDHDKGWDEHLQRLRMVAGTA
ncbi:MAG: SRPBCC domain-containing protein [Hyphomonadaceae bacterium]|nr:SRPBCC domain-containing protein [Hyphomonadaceae bacterium]